MVWANTRNLSRCLDMIHEGDIDSIGLNSACGSDINNVTPFVEWKKLKGLVMPYSEDADLSNLGQMDFLEFLVIGGAPGPIDLSGFSSLVDLSIDWNKKLSLPSSPDVLRGLRLDGYAPADRNLVEISRYSGLMEIEFVKGNLESLEGCEEFAALERVELHYLSKLKYVKSLSKTPVKKVSISNCKRVTDLNALVDCPELEILHYHDSAPLDSIDFLRGCKALKEFRFVGVDVVDGDMTPLVQLQEFAFTRKRHFSHTEKMLRDLQKDSGNQPQ